VRTPMLIVESVTPAPVSTSPEPPPPADSGSVVVQAETANRQAAAATRAGRVLLIERSP
jgi:hypothetical protein